MNIDKNNLSGFYNLQIKNTNKGINPLYGKVNFDNIPVYPKKEKFVVYNNGRNDVLVLDVVLDMFLGFKKYMQFSKMRGVLNSNNEKINNPQIYSTPYFFEDLYENHLQTLKKTLIERIKNQENINQETNIIPQKISSFDNFLDYTIQNFLPLVKNFFISEGGVVLSSLFSPVDTGLCIFLDDGNINSGVYKQEMYYQDDYFDFYQRSLNKFGFSLDKNTPWKVHVNFFSTGFSEALARVSKKVLDRGFWNGYYNFALCKSDDKRLLVFLLDVYSNVSNLCLEKNIKNIIINNKNIIYKINLLILLYENNLYNKDLYNNIIEKKEYNKFYIKEIIKRINNS